VAFAKERPGWAVVLGTVGYAVGKFAVGSLVDLLGGRRNYLIGMAGAVACTILFALGRSIPVFTFVWIMNRLIQSLGWPGIITMTSRWFSYASYDTVKRVISLGFLSRVSDIFKLFSRRLGGLE
jgi:sugar phosphate permease